MISFLKIFRSHVLLLKHFKFIWFCVLFLCVRLSVAQNAVLSTGLSQTDDTNGAISYSIGQVAFRAISETKAKIAVGVQNAYEIYIVKVIDNEFSNLKLKAYPNPFADFVILETNVFHNSKMGYQIDDIYGKKIVEGAIKNQWTKIDLSPYHSALYMLTVHTDKSLLKTLIILKQ